MSFRAIHFRRAQIQLTILVLLTGCSGTKPGGPDARVDGPQPPQMASVVAASVPIGGGWTSMIAALERTGLFENSGANAERHGGEVSVTKAFAISIESVRVAEFVAFLNQAAGDSEIEAATGYVILDEYSGVVLEGDRFLAVPGREAEAVVSATYAGATAFCSALSQANGDRYRLPTEAEWIVAEQQLEFPVEHVSAGVGWEVGNWVSDLYSDSLRSITSQVDSTGPDEASRSENGQPCRVVRLPIDALANRRTWGCGNGRQTGGASGFRVVREP